MVSRCHLRCKFFCKFTSSDYNLFMYRIIFFLITVFGIYLPLSASVFPFSDVKTSDSSYAWVKLLYDNGIIYDNGSGLFYPDEPIGRDLFVWLATSVSCKKCLIPSTQDIISYQISPFSDLLKNNPNYYCIAYAAEQDIIQWYPIDENGTITCQNGIQNSSVSFCPDNNTTRIEAAAILLRQAGIWDDAKNTSFSKTYNFSDVTPYWYGYAEKWVESGILQIQDSNHIYPDAIITRGEFATMAGIILAYNQCAILDNQNSIASDMVVRQANGEIIEKTVFDIGTTDILSVISSQWDWAKKWTLTNPITGEILTGNGDTYPLISVGVGKWISEVELIDKDTLAIMSTAKSTIVIVANNEYTDTMLSVDIEADPLIAKKYQNINISAIVMGGAGAYIYAWDFGDGTQWTISGDTQHIYTQAGSYTITLTVIDGWGNTSQSSLVVVIGNDKDKDDDGILDVNDTCPDVFGIAENKGCPVVATRQYGETISSLLAGITNSTEHTLLSGIQTNACLLRKNSTNGLIIAEPICDKCPCDNKVNILSQIRACDILFPTILSPDASLIYSRGGFYQIP